MYSIAKITSYSSFSIFRKTSPLTISPPIQQLNYLWNHIHRCLTSTNKTDDKHTTNNYNLNDKENKNQEKFVIDNLLKPNFKAADNANFLVHNYTAPALAAAFQDRERTLQICSQLLHDRQLDELERILKPFSRKISDPAMKTNKEILDLSSVFSKYHRSQIRKRLNRLPRHLSKAWSRRASVFLPLCHAHGEPSILFNLRSRGLGRHQGEICFPGGMVDQRDFSIIQTCLREMNEELGIPSKNVQILGILRCDWSEIESMTGVAVTPVVGYIGEISDVEWTINADEVEECFTVPFKELVDETKWIKREGSSPVFTGGKHVIWGLTAHILHRCLETVLYVDKERELMGSINRYW